MDPPVGGPQTQNVRTKKMKNLRIVILVLGFIICIASAYRFGIEVTEDAWAQSLESVQAMLAFNHLKQFQEISECITNGKVEAAHQRIKMAIITEKELVSGYLKSHESGQAVDYIERRYKGNISNLREYQSNRGVSYTVPSCQ